MGLTTSLAPIAPWFFLGKWRSRDERHNTDYPQQKKGTMSVTTISDDSYRVTWRKVAEYLVFGYFWH